MSYNFYSLVSSIKDKSTQAMATLSSDLKEFTNIMQEDVAEVAKTMRHTVHEKSETLRQRVEQRRQDGEQDGPDDNEIGEEEEEKEAEKDDGAAPAEAAEAAEGTEAEEKTSRRTSGSFFSFAALSLEEVGSKLLQSADVILGTLAGDGEDDGALDDEVENARRYRLLALQEDVTTYTEAPVDADAFAAWKESVSEEQMKEIQEEVLEHYPVVTAKLKELVPDTVAEADFWARYVFKASQLAAQAQRGADLLEHALKDEEEIGWDVDSPRHGDTANKPDSPPRPATAESGSETESWIDLDGQRREGSGDAKANPPPLKESGEQEEDVDWGDDDDPGNGDDASDQQAQGGATETDEKKKGDDWGEWD